MGASTYTTHGVSVKFEDNSPLVLEALKRATTRGLEACGAKAESYAKQELSKPKLHKDDSVRPNVITGRLRNSISHAVRGEKVYIGTNVKYAPFVEFGTRNAPAYPYLQPAALNHSNEYKEILKDSLRNA